MRGSISVITEKSGVEAEGEGGVGSGSRSVRADREAGGGTFGFCLVGVVSGLGGRLGVGRCSGMGARSVCGGTSEKGGRGKGELGAKHI